MKARFFEDFDVGESFETPARTISEADVVAFAGLSGDYNPLHTDESFAKTTQYGVRIAHGLLGMSVMTGLIARTGVFDGTALALLGIEDWSFRMPIRLGSTIHVEMRITKKRRTTDGARGVLWRHMRILDDENGVVQEGTFKLLVRCRNADAGEADSV